MSRNRRRQKTTRESSEPARPSVRPATSPSRRRPWLLWTAALLLVIGLPTGVHLLRQQPASNGSSPEGPAIPELDVSAMDAPVARAIGEARAGVLREPRSAAAWGKYGMVLDAHGQIAPAITCYGRAHALQPDEFRWAYLLALMRNLHGDPLKEVAAAFDTAIRLRPGSPIVHFRLGDALVRRGELEPARNAYERALELQPDFALSHRNLGQVLVSLDEPKAAVEHLERARALVPSDRFTLAMLARAHGLAGDGERARELAQVAPSAGAQASFDDPDRLAVERLAVDPVSSVARAQELMKSHRYAEALVDLKRFAAASPDQPTVEMHLGTCYIETGQVDLAFEHLTRAVRLQDDLGRAHIGLGYLRAVRGEFAAASVHYRRAAELDPGNAAVLRELGQCLGRTGAFDEAEDAFVRAAALAPPDAQGEYTWATVLYQKRDFKAAASHFRAALKLESSMPEATYWLGRSLEGLGAIDEAVALYRGIARDAPQHAAARRLSELGVSP